MQAKQKNAVEVGDFKCRCKTSRWGDGDLFCDHHFERTARFVEKSRPLASKLKRNDFLVSGKTLGTPEKVMLMALDKQIKSKSAMFACIDRSFLTAERQAAFRALVEERRKVLLK